MIKKIIVLHFSAFTSSVAAITHLGQIKEAFLPGLEIKLSVLIIIMFIVLKPLLSFLIWRSESLRNKSRCVFLPFLRFKHCWCCTVSEKWTYLTDKLAWCLFGGTKHFFSFYGSTFRIVTYTTRFYWTSS